ncbi:asparaginase [Bordetella genomosp. 9]|uniref:L-asparaginase n=1 Tax=Bordetella genomosp. 9 TaxID=1416803 RepID=A0A1W6Z534_9BORD|nr:asparaginase [Bordetella genomosp. 9]ARP88396.1 L-asparaginase [Bordetella genomosp. 9]
MPEHRALPTVTVLGTGGTIAGAPVAGLRVGYVPGTIDIESLLDGVPGLASLANLRAEQVANIGSQDMRHDVWQGLATRVSALQQDTDIDGIVVTHGTDTLEETAWFLELAVPLRKPLVLTGAMRPATALGSEGPANLYAAVAVARDEAAQGRGALVLMNEHIHHARDVQKIAASGIAAFASPTRGPAGIVQAGGPLFYGTARPRAHYPWQSAPLPPVEQWPRVGVVYAHADMQPDLIDFMASRYQGIVLAGVGDGNASQAAFQAIGRATGQGVAVVRASRTASGHVQRNTEVDDDALGTVAAGDLSPQKARILLTLALMSTRDAGALQRCFDAA